MERKEDKGSFIHQCSESGEGSPSEEDIEFKKVITLDPVWAEFNETFREIMSRKM